MEKIPFKELETNRLYLRQHEVTFDYATLLFQKIKKDWDHIKVWLPKMWLVKAPEDEYTFFVNARKEWENHEKANYAIVEKGTNEIVGTVGFFDVSWTDAHAEIGYFLFSPFTKKGYVTEAVQAIQTWAFEQGFNRLQIRMDTGNAASENVAKRLGYVKEGDTREEHYSPHFNAFRDIRTYALLKREWEKQR